MAVYLDALYFRLDENRYFVPVSLIVPGSQIPFVKGGDKDKATLDILGEVIDEVKRPIGQARETVKLNLDPSLQARQKNIQYTTSFNLPPGKYHLKFVVRENQTGRMGSFEADITLPEMKKAPLKMSSILLASARQPSKKLSPWCAMARSMCPTSATSSARISTSICSMKSTRQRAKNRLRTNPRDQAGHQPAQQPRTDPGLTKVYETPLVQARADQRGGPRRGGCRTGCAAEPGSSRGSIFAS
jgi:hypothetical protein